MFTLLNTSSSICVLLATSTFLASRATKSNCLLSCTGVQFADWRSLWFDDFKAVGDFARVSFLRDCSPARSTLIALCYAAPYNCSIAFRNDLLIAS